MPAFEQNRSMAPCRLTTSATTLCTSPSCETSAAIGTPPISSATRRAAASSRSTTTMVFAHSTANRRHRARPMPLPPPVTTTTLSLRFTTLERKAREARKAIFAVQSLRSLRPLRSMSSRRLYCRVFAAHPGLQRADVLLHGARRGEENDGENRRENRHDVHRRVQPV